MASIIYKGGVSTGGGGSTTWQEKTADFTAQSGYGYFVDSTSNILVTLPANPSIGNTVQIALVSGRVAFDGKINGELPPGDDVYKGSEISGQVIVFYYLNSSYGWFCDNTLPINLSFGSGDPYFNDVVLYIKGDGTNGSTNIIDESLTPKTITVNGGAQINTAQSKYGGSSIYFDNNTFLSATDSSLAFSGDFTIEAWCRFSGLADFDSPWSHQTAPTFFTYRGKYYLRNGGTELITPTTHGLSLNTWTHIAISRGSGIVRIFTNGVETVSASLSTDFADTTFWVGGMQSHRYFGYIDSLRVTKTARYTANFDPEIDTYLAY